MPERGQDTLDTTTIPPPTRAAAPEAEARVVCLTILHHPDPSRVGEAATLDGLDRGDRVPISRAAPDFFRRGVPRGRPLRDPYLSRKPLYLEGDGRGGVRLDATTTSTAAAFTLDAGGAPSEVASGLALESGAAFLDLGGRVLLGLRRARRRPRRGVDYGLLGTSDALGDVQAAIDRLGPLDEPVLIRGETGVGKELIARGLHRASGRAGRFVAVDLGALEPRMADSALFGHAAGAFTGADRARRGFFLEADGGTLFLDELGNLDLEVQRKLLRALQEREIVALGTDRPRQVDARVLAATDADLEAMMAEGRLLEPLYHRLAALALRAPPLRERPEDAAALLVRSLGEALAKVGRPERLAPAERRDPWLPLAVTRALLRRRWPGNVRELKAAALRLAVEHADAPRAAAPPAPAPPSPASSERAPPAAPTRRERPTDAAILAALEAEGYVISRAAKSLGVAENTVRAVIDRTPGMKRCPELSAAEISEALASAGALAGAARRLKVSARGLRLRMKQLGLAPPR